MLSHFALAFVTFLVTNIDDLLLLSIYFASPQYTTRTIVAGQYLGIGTLILISLSGFVLGRWLAEEWISLLGIVPLLLGVKGLIALRKPEEHEAPDDPQQKSPYQWLHVALVTIANGGDNLGVYTPLFATTQGSSIYVYIITWLALTGLWCVLGYWIVKHPKVKTTFEKQGHWILPFFLILLGLFIMKDAIRLFHF